MTTSDLQYDKIDSIVDQQLQAGQKKTTATLPRLILLGVMAGFFVAFGAESSSLAMHSIDNVGLARTLAGTIFPLGLLMILFLGGELFTGDCLMAIAVFSGKVKPRTFLKTLIIVYFSNFLGACLMAWMIANCGQLNFSDGGAGAFTIKVALGKATVNPQQAFISGILCNILVCLAIFMANAARDITGKCLAVFFPILAFVVSGFEHCVANMYYIPAGIFALQNPAYAEKATELYQLSAQQLSAVNWPGMIHNLIPVTAGNMVGGIIFVGLSYWMLYERGAQR